jgi:hypothetical protein
MIRFLPIGARQVPTPRILRVAPTPYIELATGLTTKQLVARQLLKPKLALRCRRSTAAQGGYAVAHSSTEYQRLPKPIARAALAWPAP